MSEEYQEVGLDSSRGTETLTTLQTETYEGVDPDSNNNSDENLN